MNPDLVTLISNVGFPIVMCLIVYVDLRKKVDRMLALLERIVDA